MWECKPGEIPHVISREVLLLELFAAPLRPIRLIQDLTLGFEPKLRQEVRAASKVSVNKTSTE